MASILVTSMQIIRRILKSITHNHSNKTNKNISAYRKVFCSFVFVVVQVYEGISEVNTVSHAACSTSFSCQLTNQVSVTEYVQDVRLADSKRLKDSLPASLNDCPRFRGYKKPIEQNSSWYIRQMLLKLELHYKNFQIF